MNIWKVCFVVLIVVENKKQSVINKIVQMCEELVIGW